MMGCPSSLVACLMFRHHGIINRIFVPELNNPALLHSMHDLVIIRVPFYWQVGVRTDEENSPIPWINFS
jgi:hypothetical protein